jgi:tetratricopeptide (TPR) repeat protein
MITDVLTLREKSDQAFSQGDFASTLSLLEQIGQVVGPHIELESNLAVVHYKVGNLQLALQHFRQALALQGESQHLVANNLLDILADQGAVIDGLRLAAQGISAAPVLPCEAIAQIQPLSLRCPLCKQEAVHFLPVPDFYRENARRYGFVHFGCGEMTALDSYSCSHCGASDRERLYVYWLEREVAAGHFLKGQRMIHFAPEPVLSRLLKGCQYFDYATADLMMSGVDYKVDLMDMPFDEGVFDFFICSHILEHVADDGQAIRELYRVTREGGCGILMAPVCVGLESTIEDPAINDEAGRWRLFGQNDHVRLYAHNDYVSKIEANGFSVEQLGIEYFGADIFAALGLKATSILYIARKIARS